MYLRARRRARGDGRGRRGYLKASGLNLLAELGQARPGIRPGSSARERSGRYEYFRFRGDSVVFFSGGCKDHPAQSRFLQNRISNRSVICRTISTTTSVTEFHTSLYSTRLWGNRHTVMVMEHGRHTHPSLSFMVVQSTRRKASLTECLGEANRRPAVPEGNTHEYTHELRAHPARAAEARGAFGARRHTTIAVAASNFSVAWGNDRAGTKGLFLCVPSSLPAISAAALCVTTQCTCPEHSLHDPGINTYTHTHTQTQ